MPDNNFMIYLWLGATLVLGILEAITVGLDFVWFAAGALVAFVAALLGAHLFVQIVLFLSVSFILLYFTRPLVKKFLIKGKVSTNYDMAIGKKGLVLESINNLHAKGLIDVMGQKWTARSLEAEETFEPGDEVEVVKIEGVKAFVKKYRNEEQEAN